ncbi:MAG: carboxylating nicotinate-nucleotide diphosphorylase [Planctomycetota bacterium]
MATPVREFEQVCWNEQLAEDSRWLIRRALAEDLGEGDLTSLALIPAAASGKAACVARQPGIVAGLPVVPLALREVDHGLRLTTNIGDAEPVAPGECVAWVEGPVASVLAAERLMLNLLGRLSGIASLTRRYVEAVAGTGARIYDTRKTTPGWRLLEKYAVRCGGGNNHRSGLYEAILIKDNHLAFGAGPLGRFSPAEAVRRAREFAERHATASQGEPAILEIEVDTLDQLIEVLPARPDIVLLDNMPPDVLREAVARRNALAPEVELEASGGVTIATVRSIAESGVERISIGGLTHSAVALDFGLDWPDSP